GPAVLALRGWDARRDAPQCRAPARGAWLADRPRPHVGGRARQRVRDAPAPLEARHPRPELMRIEPLTSATWTALVDVFREGGDPRWCYCQFWRLRAKDFSALKV